MGESRISNNLSSQIQQLSEIVHDKSLGKQEKEAKLKEAAAKTLNQIDTEIPALNFVNAKFASKIKDLIVSSLKDAGKWNAIAPPALMQVNLSALKGTAQALTDATRSMGIDTADVMRILMEAQRKLGMIHADRRLTDRADQIASAQKKFDETAAANKNQFLDDMLKAGGEALTGLIQVGGGALSAIKAGGGIKKSSDLLEKSHELDGLTANKNVLRNKTESLGKQLEAADIEVKQAKADLPGKSGYEKYRATERIRGAEVKQSQLQGKFNENQKALQAAGDIESGMRQKLEFEHEKLRARNQRWEAAPQIINGISSIISKGAFQAASAHFSYEASSDRLDAEKAGLDQELAAQMVQSDMEAYRNAMEGANSARQSLEAMMQSSHSSISNIVRA